MQPTAISQQKILENLSIAALNPMQQEMQNSFQQNNDLLLLSPTGSGKTLGFLLPILETLLPEKNNTQVLILVPSRELALQIESVFKSMKTDFGVSCCYGGHPVKIEINNLSVSPTVIIGTPGRITDHINRNSFDAATIHTIVFDEFDKSLEFGFKTDMAYIMRHLPNLQKRVLTSATQAVEIPDFVGVKNLLTLNYLQQTNQSAGLKLRIVHSEDTDKLATFLRLIGSFLTDEQTIVFCNHREVVERISNHLNAHDIINESYHGGLDQQQRELALCKFRNGSVNMLITTDLASRGLDISNIANIVHYQKPHTEETYIHRNGRTARMGKEGNAFLMLTDEEKMPEYIAENTETQLIETNNTVHAKPKWVTLNINRGKKDKVNKTDIVGFLSKVGKLEKDELGIIEVKDFCAYPAVLRSKVKSVLKNIDGAKIKGKAVKITIA
jgi:superfamily II DNA/RNA helicase